MVHWLVFKPPGVLGQWHDTCVKHPCRFPCQLDVIYSLIQHVQPASYKQKRTVMSLLTESVSVGVWATWGPGAVKPASHIPTSFLASLLQLFSRSTCSTTLLWVKQNIYESTYRRCIGWFISHLGSWGCDTCVKHPSWFPCHLDFIYLLVQPVNYCERNNVK